jgi:peptidoglycan/xylan/chitin deacetylase (PgdA/CDA1 family)
LEDWSNAHLRGATDDDIFEIRNIVPRGNCNVTLTFDDGPESKDTRTERILETLAANKIRGTFFLLGSVIENDAYSTKIIKKIFEAGHFIGSHSYDHEPHTSLKHEKITENIKKSKGVIQPYLYDLFRLPFGDGNYFPLELSGLNRFNYLKKQKFIFDTLKAEGFQNINWNCDSKDWQVIELFGKGVLNDKELNHIARKKVIIKVLNDLKNSGNNGGIILFHDVHEHTVRNISYYIDVIRGLGYTIVGLEQFTKTKPKLLL